MSHHLDSDDGLIVFYWLFGWLTLSVLYRLVRRKPVLFFSVPGAQYVEHGASGGEARNCLVVAISAGRLIIRPFFPFNLLLLPEIYGLEFDVPVEDVVWVQLLPIPEGSLWRKALQGSKRNVQVRIRQPGSGERTFELRLANPESFVKLLPKHTQF